MSVPFKRLRTALHLSIFALLMLGVALKPVLGGLCETHFATHALSEHGHPAAGAADHHEALTEHEIDQEHASGAHGLMHEDDQGTAYADIAVATILLPAVRGPTQIGARPFVSVPEKHLPGPFRPPIA